MAANANPNLWVQLYYDGEGNPVGGPIKINPIPDDVNDLKIKVHEEKSTKLNHIDADDLIVYASGTPVPITEGSDYIRANVICSEAATGASFERPLIMVAPKPVQQNGAWRYVVFLY
eukprot:scaffold190876_cov61-Attheya_sp.AAC.1